MGVGGAVGLSTAANIFVGMVEAPLFIRPYLAQLSRSEMFMVMTGGMAGIAGTVFVLYATILRAVIPDAAGTSLIASVLAAPAAIVIGRIMVPESSDGADRGALVDRRAGRRSTMDAHRARARRSGLELLLNICAMLIVLMALVHLANAALGLLPDDRRRADHIAAPARPRDGAGVLADGHSVGEAATAGSLMGIKTVLNEFIAYVELAKLPAEALSPRSRLIMLYAMCGFANFGSLGIMIGGLTAMAPERRADIVVARPEVDRVGHAVDTC